MRVSQSVLASAALLVTTNSFAADLPVKAAAPIEYVRVCTTYGAGFFYVPGTDSCLRISARMRLDIRYLEPTVRDQDAFGTRVRGRVNFDNRTQTSYGLLRTYIRYEFDRDSGTPFTDTGAITTNPKLEQAFVQFGGLTAGKATSFFSNVDLPTLFYGTLRFDDTAEVALLAYTYSFGNGFSATLSLEDPISRRLLNTDVGYYGNSPALYGTSGAYALTTGGARMPDLVGNVRYMGEWGGVQLSGALHQVRDLAFNAYGVPPAAGGALLDPRLPLYADTEYGFAAMLSGYVKLPMIGAGDVAWLTVSYADGALAYINGGQEAPSYTSVLSANPLREPWADGFVSALTGDIKTLKAWSVAGEFIHYWSPNWRSSVFGSYAKINVPGGATVFDAGTFTVRGLDDFNELRLGANTQWLPVEGMQIGVEVAYTRIEGNSARAVEIAGAGGAVTVPSSREGIWEGRLRFQRDW